MLESVKDKVAIITGGGRGLGRAMAIGLVKAGAKVTITSAKEGIELEDTYKICKEIGGEESILKVQADVTITQDCRNVFEQTYNKWGRIQVLVNNAGRGMTYVDPDFVKIRPPFWTIKDDIWKMIVETNLNGIFNMSKLAVPYFLKHDWGRIINISTSLPTMQRRGYAPYGTTKWGVEGLTQIMALDLEDTNITANVLIPGGATDTAMIPGKVGDKTRTGADGNLFEPEIMVEPIQFLSSDISDGIRGMRYVAKLWNNKIEHKAAAKASSFSIKRERVY